MFLQLSIKEHKKERPEYALHSKEDQTSFWCLHSRVLSELLSGFYHRHPEQFRPVLARAVCLLCLLRSLLSWRKHALAKRPGEEESADRHILALSYRPLIYSEKREEEICLVYWLDSTMIQTWLAGDGKEQQRWNSLIPRLDPLQNANS